jgi:ADP-heptose:LPS heptosyltransferase
LENPRSILVIKPSSLGDVVHTLPAVACVKKRWPNARLTWLVNPEWAPLLAGNSDIDEVLEFPRSEFRGLGGLLRFRKWAHKLPKHDLVLDFQGLFRSGYMARKAGGEIWGTSDSREGARFFHKRIVKVPPRSEPVHAVRRYLALVEELGCDTSGALDWKLPSAPLPAGLPPEFVVLHPFSRGAGKSLTTAQVGAFCDALAPRPVVIAGRGTDEVKSASNVINLLNRTTLPELCTILRSAKFVVSVDSGPMHIAAALNPRLLAIHTWSDPRKVGPFSPDAWVWKDNRISRVAAFPSGEECGLDGIGEWVGRMTNDSRAKRDGPQGK